MAIVRTDAPVPPAVNATGSGLNDVVRPITGEDVDATRVILPVKPILFRVTVDVPELPGIKLVGVTELALMVKSGVTVTLTVVE